MMDRIKATANDLLQLNKKQYCELGPGEGQISLLLKENNKDIIAVEAPWALEKNKKWAVDNHVKLYLMEFFTGDFSQIQEDVDCFYLAHAIAHFRYNPHILFKKIYDKLPLGGNFYLSTVNGCSFERVLQLFRGQHITERVTPFLDEGFKEVVKDFNKTDMKMIWDDWMHVKEYTKPELEAIFKEVGFKVKYAQHRTLYPNWKKNIFVKLYPHLADEIIIVGEK